MICRRRTRTLHRCLLLALSLTLLGCVKAQLHRPENIERQDDYTMAFIEFDDHGEPWAPSQLERTLHLIENANTDGKRSLVILFVHGWQNDASKREDRKHDNNVEGFQRLLAETRQLLGRTQDNPDEISLIGVYLSWRGRSSSVKLIKPLTFYSRRGAGQRVAGVSTTEAILRVMDAAKENPRSAGIVIGHSFGGMIVERALSQAIVGYAMDREETMEPLADMIMLINPASQSMQARTLISMLERNRLKFYRVDPAGNRRESPFIVSVTSTGDTATGSLYPYALGLKGASKRFRHYEATDCSPVANQKVFYKKTAGHNRVLHSHVITTGEPLEPGTDQGAELDLQESIDPQSGETRYSFPGSEYMFTLQRVPFGYNNTPYWISSVPPELIRGHSDIFTYNTLQMIRALLQISGVALQGEKTVLVRDTGVRPIELIPLPNERVAFLEPTRRFYVWDPESRRPLGLTCLPPVIQPGNAIGVSYAGERAYVITSAEYAKGKKRKSRTDLIAFDFGLVGEEGLEWTEIRSDFVFSGAAGHSEHGRVYLSRPGELYVADLTKKKPRAELLSRFDEAIVLDRMQFDTSSNRIFAVDREAGSLYLIDLDASDSPVPHLVASDLGVPVDIEITTGWPTVIADAGGKRILAIDCSGSQGCSAPETFAAIPDFERPVEVTRTDDGTVWVGDLAAKRIFAFDSDGNLIRVLESMSGLDD